MPEASATAPESILSDNSMQIPPDNDAISAVGNADAIDNNNEKEQQENMVVLGSDAAYEITQDQLQDLLNQGILSSVPESAVATAVAATDVMQECEDEIEAEGMDTADHKDEAIVRRQPEVASPRRYSSRRASRRMEPEKTFEVGFLCLVK